MKHGSLFAGIGGFDLGFERAGIETIWQVEIDEYCRKVLARHFPHAQRFSDIRECGAHNLLPVDVLSGGFPCQDISNAGKRAGIDGERSGLWSEYARIIRELRPRFVVVENVAALLGRGMERVLGDLAAIGYDTEWQSIRASDVGAPHRRERIWIVAYPSQGGLQGLARQQSDDQRERESDPAIGSRLQRRTFIGREDVAHSNRTGPSSEWDGIPRRQDNAISASSRALADSNSTRCRERRRTESVRPEQYSVECNGETLADTKEFSGELRSATRERSRRLAGSGNVGDSASSRLYASAQAILYRREESGRPRHEQPERSDWWAVEPDVGRVAHGIPARVDRLRGLGNAIVPQIAEWIGKRLMAQGQPEKESKK